ncbi:MAG: hypothetical protein ACFFEL_13285, partial [Candidatus Thorarchaeota archaeon]
IDNRQNINANASGIIVSAVYDYDGAVFDGALTLNNTDYDGDGTAVRWGYTVLDASGDTFDITAISSNDVTYMIWDSVTITITDPTDNRQNLNANASGIIVSAVYDYDGSVFDGTFTLNNTDFDGDGTAIKWGYTVLGVSGSSFGITSISSNDETFMIWDSLTISVTGPTDNRQGINANASGIVLSAVYDYDGAVFDGVLTLNQTDFDGDGTVVKWGYTVDSASGDTYGITIISSNDETYMIWDQLVITIGVDDSTPLNGIQANFTLAVLFDYDDTACTSYQIVVYRNGTWWHSFTDANKSSFVDTNSDNSYTYTVFVVTSESTYGITSFTTNTQQVTWSLAPNENPVNDSGPVLTNGDDTDFLYARYRYYIVTTSVSDPDGYADISYVQLSLFPDDFPILYWTIRYTRATDTFSVEFGGSVVTIGAMSNAVSVGDTLTVTWYIKIGWDHPYVINIDIQQFVTDGTDNDSDFYESNWNVETRLDYSTPPYLSDDRGNINTSDLIGSGSVTYYGSSHSPLANETDVWVVRDGVEAWSGDLSAGSFSISSIGSPATTGLNNYTFKVVTEGSGFGGTDLYHTTSLNDTFITDRIEIYEAGVVDGRININSDCDVWWRARYEYDNTPIQSGLILDLNGSRTLIWYAGGLYWRWQETSVSPSSAWFDVASASESTYGLTEWFATTSAQRVIWDALIISIINPSDQRVNVGTNATGIIVSAVYAFDSV